MLVSIIDGKNREIRNLMKYFNLKVIKLKRIEYGPFKLLDLKKNTLKEILANDLSQKLNTIGFIDEDYIWKV